MELRSYANDVIKKEQGAFIRDAEGFSIIKNNEITNIGLFNFITTQIQFSPWRHN